jgi:hypothetical protein
MTQGRVGMLEASVAMETSSAVSISPLRLSRAESLEARWSGPLIVAFRPEHNTWQHGVSKPLASHMKAATGHVWEMSTYVSWDLDGIV